MYKSYKVATQTTCLALALILAGCTGAASQEQPGAPAGSRAHALNGTCPAQAPDVLFFDNFEGDLSKWIRYTTQPTDPGHNWSISSSPPVASGAAQLRSDPAGSTKAQYYNRLDSVPFSLAGRENVHLHFDTRHQINTNGGYQVYVRTFSGDKVSLIGDFLGQNLAWPGFEHKDLLIPQAFWGEPAVRVTFLIQAGPNGGDFGAVVDNVLVTGAPVSQSCDVAFFDSFEGGSLSKWDIYSDPGTPGHVWDLAAAPSSNCASALEARSDPAGSTQPLNYTRLESKPFSLVGKSSATIQVQARWLMGGDDRFQIFVADRDTSNIRSLVADFGGRNASYPANDTLEIPVPAVFLGRPRISVAFLALTGAAGPPGFGAAIDDVKVVTDCGQQ